MLDFLNNNPVVVLAMLQAAGAFLLVGTFIGTLQLTGRVE